MISPLDIQRRNELLQNVFNYFKIPVVLLGSADSPAIISKSCCLCCYVHNFNLNFTSAPREGRILFSLKLDRNQQYPEDFIEKFIQWFKETPHRKVFRIAYSGTELMLSGYNFQNRELSQGRYPVFAQHGEKIYFDEAYAQSIVETYNNLPLEIR